MNKIAKLEINEKVKEIWISQRISKDDIKIIDNRRINHD